MIDAAASVFVNQGEGGTGYVVRPGGAQSADDALRQGGLARSQIAGQKDDAVLRQFARQAPAQFDGLGLRSRAVRRHIPPWRAEGTAEDR